MTGSGRLLAHKHFEWICEFFKVLIQVILIGCGVWIQTGDCWVLSPNE